MALLVHKISAAKIAEEIGISSRQVERIIKKLKSDGKLIRHGSAKGGYWDVVI